MKRLDFKNMIILFWIMVVCVSFLSAGDKQEIVIAMTRPEVRQIQNIEEMLEKDIIPLKRLRLIGVYHENENIDYTPAHRYVKKKKMEWVSFYVVKGKVEVADLFKENIWTPQFREILEQTAGIIFTGGEDLPPAIYGEEQLLLTEATTPNRSLYETSFLFHLLGSSRNKDFQPFLESRKDYVVLGICLGCQTMNVACGGTLFQDIPTEVYGYKTVQEVLKSGQDNIHTRSYIVALHPMEEDDLAPVFHRIRLDSHSKFIQEMSMKTTDSPLVLSSHHQCVNQIGQNLNVTATSMDGKIVEALEHQHYKNVLGVQFHPEVFKLYKKSYFFQEGPGKPRDFNLREMLENNPPAMTFHLAIWKWFARALKH